MVPLMLVMYCFDLRWQQNNILYSLCYKLLVVLIFFHVYDFYCIFRQRIGAYKKLCILKSQFGMEGESMTFQIGASVEGRSVCNSFFFVRFASEYRCHIRSSLEFGPQ
jgi:hypothetical protein